MQQHRLNHIEQKVNKDSQIQVCPHIARCSVCQFTLNGTPFWLVVENALMHFVLHN